MKPTADPDTCRALATTAATSLTAQPSSSDWNLLVRILWLSFHADAAAAAASPEATRARKTFSPGLVRALIDAGTTCETDGEFLDWRQLIIALFISRPSHDAQVRWLERVLPQ
jgi:hypothetical protein